MTAETTPHALLRIDGGADHPDSISRSLADELVQRIAGPATIVIRRDVTSGLPFVNGDRVAASAGALTVSDELVGELLEADEPVIVAPVHNFSIPAAIKAWIDQVARGPGTFGHGRTLRQSRLSRNRTWQPLQTERIGSLEEGNACQR